MKTTTITPIQATELGLKSLTYPYVLPDEQWMLDNILADLQGIRHELVEIEGVGVEVWRG